MTDDKIERLKATYMEGTSDAAVKLDVYTIVRNGQKAFWQKVGRAHINKDGSWNVYLNCLPVNGELNIRDRKSTETAQAE
jgi:hypothetical protein